MTWLELSFQVPNEHTADLLAEALGQVGFNSFEVSENVLKAYTEKETFVIERVNEVLKNAYLSNVVWLTTSELAEKNWNEIWESNFPPVIVNQLCRVRAPFHPKDSNFEFDLVIEPRMSFGTAHHETTAQVMDLMFRYAPENRRVLDMGCGTGVLAILASLLKAKTVVAIDNDEWAFSNACDNVALNQVQNVQVELGDALRIGYRTFDLILANINRNILLNDLKLYSEALLPGGFVILSGFYESDLETITKEAALQCLTYVEHTSRNHWVAAVFYKH